MSSEISIPLVIRGEVIERDWVTFSGRRDGVTFRAPDMKKYASMLVLRDPSRMSDLNDLSIEDVTDYLVRLGPRLHPDRSAHMRKAYEVSQQVSGLTPDILSAQYKRGASSIFSRTLIDAMIDKAIGRHFLSGWHPQKLDDGRTTWIRAMGARTVHINAGNSPMVAATCVLRNAIIRSDAIVKSPSNDPFTAAAIALEMIEMAPAHPLTRHFCAAYWKGGDEAVEMQIYRNDRIEKIVAWGGFASMQHIAKYIGPGIDLIAMDPKLSATIIGKEAFASAETIAEVARRLAYDVGMYNQEACASARVVFVESGTDAEGLTRLNDLAARLYEQIQELPLSISAPHPSFSPELRVELAALHHNDYYQLHGDGDDRGAVIASLIDESVDFSPILGCRVANLVPLDDIEDAVSKVTIHTQTIGVYPDELRVRLRERLALHGAQRMSTLGFQTQMHFANPHDAIEPLRRMVRWIIDDEIDRAPWETPISPVPEN